MLLVGLHVLERVGRRDLAVLDRNLSEPGRHAVGPPPFGQVLPAVMHLDHLEFVVVVA